MKALVLNAFGRSFELEDVDVATPIGRQDLVEEYGGFVQFAGPIAQPGAGALLPIEEALREGAIRAGRSDACGHPAARQLPAGLLNVT
jgi:hypothetical protein